MSQIDDLIYSQAYSTPPSQFSEIVRVYPLLLELKDFMENYATFYSLLRSDYNSDYEYINALLNQNFNPLYLIKDDNSTTYGDYFYNFIMNSMKLDNLSQLKKFIEFVRLDLDWGIIFDNLLTDNIDSQFPVNFEKLINIISVVSVDDENLETLEYLNKKLVLDWVKIINIIIELNKGENILDYITNSMIKNSISHYYEEYELSDICRTFFNKIREFNPSSEIIDKIDFLCTEIIPSKNLPNFVGSRLANICFTTSVIQLINRIIPVREYILNNDLSSDNYLNNLKLIIEYINNYRHLTPQQLINIITQNICPILSSYRLFGQEDAVELLSSIIDKLEQFPHSLDSVFYNLLGFQICSKNDLLTFFQGENECNMRHVNNFTIKPYLIYTTNPESSSNSIYGKDLPLLETLYDNQGPLYRLIGFIRHSTGRGRRALSGHYIAYIKYNDSFIEYNDLNFPRTKEVNIKTLPDTLVSCLLYELID